MASPMSKPTKRTEPNDFTRQAAESDAGLLAELWDFLVHNKKWWLLPIFIVLGLVGLLVLLSSSAAAPFIYPLF
jgi:hypothetical protein